MVYSKGYHTVFCHRYHIVWSTKYRYDVLRGELRLRIREIIRQVCAELGVDIIKGRSSRRIRQEFLAIRKRYWGCHFWARSYFSTTSGAITDDVILKYLDEHIEPTHVSR